MDTNSTPKYRPFPHRTNARSTAVGQVSPGEEDDERHCIPDLHAGLAADLASTRRQIEHNPLTLHIAIETEGRSERGKGQEAGLGHHAATMLPELNANGRDLIVLIHGGADEAVVFWS